MEVVRTQRFFSAVPRRWWKCSLLCAVLIGLGVVTFRIIDLVEFGLVVGPIIGDSNIMEDAVENGRSDQVKALTDAAGGQKDPDNTEIRLKRAHHWFWTPLLTADSFGMHVKLQWQNNDLVEVTLDFGCLIYMTHPVEQVGSIRISYHFTNGDKALAKGCPD